MKSGILNALKQYSISHDLERSPKMGVYLNPTSDKFRESINSEIYVDKSGLIAEMNEKIQTEQKYVCVSRPRRFGKSMTLKMLAAYYTCEENTRSLFTSLKISGYPSFEKYLNQYDVIFLNMQEFLSVSSDMQEMIVKIRKCILWDLLEKYPDFRYFDQNDLVRTMRDIYQKTRRPFIILIDEWDCIFREYIKGADTQRQYLDFLRDWLKDKEYIGLAYMTGILPIKKYGTHSALNMFMEFSMTNPKQLAEYVGFTEAEVCGLCEQYHMSLEDMKAWYDGYFYDDFHSIYSPKSVVEAMLTRKYDNYWNQTETFEALKVYIQMNYDGLKDKVIEMIAGAQVKINTGSFTNDMTTFHNADDVLTLLIHLGYLAYDFDKKEVFIPNKEVSNEYINAINVIGWVEIIRAVKASEDLLKALWNMDEEKVAAGIEETHQSTSILQYNDENALSYTVNLAFYAAREYYTIIRELPSGKGFADLVYIPRQKFADIPAVVIELKWNVNAKGAIAQIKEKKYCEALAEYKGNLLLVGVNYDKETKKHSCVIEHLKLRDGA